MSSVPLHSWGFLWLTVRLTMSKHNIPFTIFSSRPKMTLSTVYRMPSVHLEEAFRCLKSSFLKVDALLSERNGRQAYELERVWRAIWRPELWDPSIPEALRATVFVLMKKILKNPESSCLALSFPYLLPKENVFPLIRFDFWNVR